MEILSYEFIDGPDSSINGMLRQLVKELRHNRSEIPAEQFRLALPKLRNIEQILQNQDSQIRNPRRDYIAEIMQALDKEFDDETNLKEDLRRATAAMVATLLNRQTDIDEFTYSTERAEHYHFLTFSGYADKRPIDASLLLAREVFKSISSKYNYIFIDLSA